jgi:hypothetical protein
VDGRTEPVGGVKFALRFEAVSTFNREGLDLYGKRMMASFIARWPNDINLRVYTEGWDQWLQPDLHDHATWLLHFKNRHRDRKFNDYRWDAVKFAHKVAAVTHAAMTTSADVLIWLDGDIYTHSAIKEADLEKLAPVGEEWIAWLDRKSCYPECGFFMLNCKHPRHREMIAAFLGMYLDDKLFDLAEWHDSYVLNHVVEKSGIQTKSLSGEGCRTMHPLVNGPLGRWFDHLKGDRKRRGKSTSADIKVRRTEDYWR